MTTRCSRTPCRSRLRRRRHAHQGNQPRAIAAATDGNGVDGYLDPYAGGRPRCGGGRRATSPERRRPVALTDCMNFGNPERLDVYYQMEQAVRGMAAACEILGSRRSSPATFASSTRSNGMPCYPTPVIVGCPRPAWRTPPRRCPMAFQAAGDVRLPLGCGNLRDRRVASWAAASTCARSTVRWPAPSASTSTSRQLQTALVWRRCRGGAAPLGARLLPRRPGRRFG